MGAEELHGQLVFAWALPLVAELVGMVLVRTLVMQCQRQSLVLIQRVEPELEREPWKMAQTGQASPPVSAVEVAELAHHQAAACSACFPSASDVSVAAAAAALFADSCPDLEGKDLVALGLGSHDREAAVLLVACHSLEVADHSRILEQRLALRESHEDHHQDPGSVADSGIAEVEDLADSLRTAEAVVGNAEDRAGTADVAEDVVDGAEDAEEEVVVVVAARVSRTVQVG